MVAVAALASVITAVPDFGLGPVPLPGAVVEVAPGVRRITAANPGLMTGPGTNTYLVGHVDPVVVDPGPSGLPAHTDAIVAAAAALGSVRAIVVTHTHPDHAPGSAALAAATGAPLIGFGPGEAFEPDQRVGDGFTLAARWPAPCERCTPPDMRRTISAGRSRSTRCC